MNADLAEVGGRLLVVSQFTLHAKTKKGTRPSFIRAAHPDARHPLYEHFVQAVQPEPGTPWPRESLAPTWTSTCQRRSGDDLA
jgi:D-tyrosyl-tRNA(Tyr) deacylase